MWQEKSSNWTKLPVFAHTLNQCLCWCISMQRWTVKIRDIVIWMKRSSMAKTVLKEKQHQFPVSLYKYIDLIDARNKDKLNWQDLSIHLERATHPFLVKNHGLSLEGADSYPSHFTISWKLPQYMLRVLDEANRTTLSERTRGEILWFRHCLLESNTHWKQAWLKACNVNPAPALVVQRLNNP